jgi:hypothetical protein
MPTRASTATADAFQQERRETVRHGTGVTVELSADARATLIAVQRAASDTTTTQEVPSAPDPTTPYEVPGSRLNLSV